MITFFIGTSLIGIAAMLGNRMHNSIMLRPLSSKFALFLGCLSGVASWIGMLGLIYGLIWTFPWWVSPLAFIASVFVGAYAVTRRGVLKCAPGVTLITSIVGPVLVAISLL
jgi:hypothetical protein